MSITDPTCRMCLAMVAGMVFVRSALGMTAGLGSRQDRDTAGHRVTRRRVTGWFLLLASVEAALQHDYGDGGERMTRTSVS